MEQVKLHRHSLLDRVKNMIITPQTEWNIIASEQPDTGKILMGYVVPLAGLAAIANFIGYGLVGYRGFAVLNWGIYQALLVFLTGILSVYITAMVIDMLAPSFGADKNFGKSFQLVAYSLTPIWIGGLLAIVPAIAIVGSLFGIYGLYLMYIGLPKMKSVPEDKLTSYFVISLLVTLVVYIVIGFILVKILSAIFGLRVGGIGIL